MTKKEIKAAAKAEAARIAALAAEAIAETAPEILPDASIAEVVAEIASEGAAHPAAVTEPVAETVVLEMAGGAEVPVDTSTSIVSLINGRIEQAGNSSLVKKWTKELKPFQALAAFFDAKSLPVSFLGNIAIYAAQKVRRLAMLEQGLVSRIDPYTHAILKSAKALSAQGIAFTGELQMATLTQDSEAALKLKLPMRLGYKKGTASTQASSTRKAMQALGMGQIVKEGTDDTLVVDFTNPVVAKILGGVFGDGTDDGEEVEA